ncbi:MAG TPA: serine hydrolase [Candidatus Acidoferrales bacterium]|nr:serine hydrolase [Candidatus Acidoferrales bacterium]
MNHTSGLPDYLAQPTVGVKLYAQTVPPADLYGLVAGEALRFKPGTTFEYSNTKYVILGAISNG